MRYIKKTSLLFFILINTACKNEKKDNLNLDINVNQKVESTYIFEVSMEAIVKEDDKFQLFYVDSYPDDSFTPENRVVSIIKGSQDAQKIKFMLPENILPYKFRIDLGEYKNESPIEINEINLKYNTNSIIIDKAILNRFFQPNIYLERVDNNYFRKFIDGRYDPFLVSTPLLNKKIELEF